MKWPKRIKPAMNWKCKIMYHPRVQLWDVAKRGNRWRIPMRRNDHCEFVANNLRYLFSHFVFWKNPNKRNRNNYIIFIWNIFFRSAFFWFCNEKRNEVKALNPEYGVGDIAKELGRKWADVEPEVKQKYELMAEKDKARYEQVRKIHMCVYSWLNIYTGYISIYSIWRWGLVSKFHY